MVRNLEPQNFFSKGLGGNSTKFYTSENFHYMVCSRANIMHASSISCKQCLKNLPCFNEEYNISSDSFTDDTVCLCIIYIILLIPKHIVKNLT